GHRRGGVRARRGGSALRPGLPRLHLRQSGALLHQRESPLLPRHLHRVRRGPTAGGAHVKKQLEGRVAIVTGGSRGIGSGYANELGSAGATVYLTGRTLREGDAPLPGSIASAAEAVDAAGGRGIAVACDHRDDAQVEALFARVLREQGRLDVLVNNAFL